MTYSVSAEYIGGVFRFDYKTMFNLQDHREIVERQVKQSLQYKAHEVDGELVNNPYHGDTPSSIDIR